MCTALKPVPTQEGPTEVSAHTRFISNGPIKNPMECPCEGKDTCPCAHSLLSGGYLLLFLSNHASDTLTKGKLNPKKHIIKIEIFGF